MGHMVVMLLCEVLNDEHGYFHRRKFLTMSTVCVLGILGYIGKGGLCHLISLAFYNSTAEW